MGRNRFPLPVAMSLEVLLVRPRGFCAGVDRAIDIVDLCLQRFGAPVYVRKEIVHNKAVVQRFRERGVVFVDELDQVPDGSLCVFSAHGVSPAVFEDARARGLEVIDATCPLVTKVHNEVRRNVKQEDSTVVLIGHDGHEEVEGTMGQAPDRVVLVQSVDEVADLDFERDTPLSYVTQTTLSVDETRGIIDALRDRFPWIEGPAKDDICYATQNRQDAVKHLVDAEGIDLLLVIGSANSSNSKRLVEVARDRGVEGHLVDGPDDLDGSWVEGKSRVGVTAGASAPEDLVQGVAGRLRELGATVRDAVVTEENVTFALPPQLRRPAGSGASD
jgi:4-hydroxy-3-methylbut-2-enyl diphosphate reductase